MFIQTEYVIRENVIKGQQLQQQQRRPSASQCSLLTAVCLLLSAGSKEDGNMRGEPVNGSRMDGHRSNAQQPTPPPPNHPPPPAPAPPSPPGHGPQGHPQGHSQGVGGGSKSSKARGVPPSFGYVKRSTSGGGSKGEARTAQVSAVPRTKLKVRLDPGPQGTGWPQLFRKNKKF